MGRTIKKGITINLFYSFYYVRLIVGININAIVLFKFPIINYNKGITGAKKL